MREALRHVPMYMELADTPQDGQTWQHVEVGTLRELRVEVYEVLTHYVVQDQDSRQTKEIRKDPVHDIVHIPLTG